MYWGKLRKTNLEVVDTICGVLDVLRPDRSPHQSLKTFVKDRPGHDRRYAIDGSKNLSLDGPQNGFEDGMRKTIQWYLDNSEWCENVTSGKYQRKG